MTVQPNPQLSEPSEFTDAVDPVLARFAGVLKEMTDDVAIKPRDLVKSLARIDSEGVHDALNRSDVIARVASLYKDLPDGKKPNMQPFCCALADVLDNLEARSADLSVLKRLKASLAVQEMLGNAEETHTDQEPVDSVASAVLGRRATRGARGI